MNGRYPKFLQRWRSSGRRAALALVAAVFVAFCGPNVEQADYRPQYVYQKYCATCHDATNLHLIKDPPRLDGLFRKKAFPSGAPATDDELRSVIRHGRDTMPPFEATLSGDDVNALVRYLHGR
jgi:mono/diheme cytochrome c family protein